MTKAGGNNKIPKMKSTGISWVRTAKRQDRTGQPEKEHAG